MNELKVFIDDNSSFSDISLGMENYIRDTSALPLVALEDYIYCGLYKKFQQLYAELSTANTNAATFTAEYYNGTTWVSLVNFIDESLGFTRSGFLKWDLDQTNWATVAVNSETLYWIRLKPSADFSAGTILGGLNIVFSNDVDMQEGYSTIDDLKASANESFIQYHQAARNEIIQLLRNAGHTKYNNELLNITKWDILKPHEIREASKWKALELFFFELSNEVGDKYDQLSQKCANKFSSAFNLYLLSIDKDDDGVLDSNESASVNFVKVIRS